ncbi:VOC family protein [Sphingobium xenophagum]|uniref:VOC family protein n=1 Tax=Sphingobium xenophagum TaxID=121428 RepID=UPI00241BF17C|nr:VOC family protein [Sphingobium xenophagum]
MVVVICGAGVFSHTTVGASDLLASGEFHDPALGVLGAKTLGDFGETIVLNGKDKSARPVICHGKGAAPSSNGVTTSFAASSTAEINAFHAADLANGGNCKAEPDLRGHLPGVYAAYLRGSADHKLCSNALSGA